MTHEQRPVGHPDIARTIVASVLPPNLQVAGNDIADHIKSTVNNALDLTFKLNWFRQPYDPLLHTLLSRNRLAELGVFLANSTYENGRAVDRFADIARDSYWTASREAFLNGEPFSEVPFIVFQLIHHNTNSDPDLKRSYRRGPLSQRRSNIIDTTPRVQATAHSLDVIASNSADVMAEHIMERIKAHGHTGFSPEALATHAATRFAQGVAFTTKRFRSTLILTEMLGIDSVGLIQDLVKTAIGTDTVTLNQGNRRRTHREHLRRVRPMGRLFSPDYHVC